MEEGSSSCPVCASEVGVSEQIINCPKCDVPHHEVCWRYNAGRCAVYACGGSRYVVGERLKRDVMPTPSNYSSRSRNFLDILPGIFFALGFVSFFGFALLALSQMSISDRRNNRPIYPYDRPYVIEEYRRGR